MPEGMPGESSTFNSALKAALGVALIATAAYVVTRIRKKAESDRRMARMEAMLDALEKDRREKTV